VLPLLKNIVKLKYQYVRLKKFSKFHILNIFWVLASFRPPLC